MLIVEGCVCKQVSALLTPWLVPRPESLAAPVGHHMSAESLHEAEAVISHQLSPALEVEEAEVVMSAGRQQVTRTLAQQPAERAESTHDLVAEGAASTDHREARYQAYPGIVFR